MSIVITGSIGFDYIFNFPGKFSDRIMPDQIHKISLSFLVDRMDKQWGGTAGNIAYTLGLFGDNPVLFATAGNDFAAYKKFLVKHGVNVSYVKEHKDIPTGTYFVITDSQDNQIGAFYTGAMQYAKDLSLSTIFNKDSLSKDRLYKDGPYRNFVLIAPNDPMAMKRYVQECKSLKIPYMYDPAFQIGNFSPAELKSAVSGCEILIGNDYEIELIRKKLKLTKKQLFKIVPTVVTTLGSKGAIIETRFTNHDLRFKNEKLRTTNYELQTISIKSAKPKNTSDPTGAGDAFRAGFLAGYMCGFDLQTCGQMGATAAVYTVEKYGTTTHRFSLAQFAKRYKANYKQVLSL